jgi:hypothetical protein
MDSQAHTDGIVWQARDGYPLYVGILLVAGAIAGSDLRRQGRHHGKSELSSGNDDASVLIMVERQRRRRFRSVLFMGLIVMQAGSFLWALRRNTVGLGLTLNPFAHVQGGWQPPGSGLLLSVCALAAAVGYAGWMAHLSAEKDL